MSTTAANLTRVYIAFNHPIIYFAIQKIIQKWKGIRQIINVSNTGQLSQMLNNSASNYLILQDGFDNLKNITALKNFISSYNNVNIFLFFPDASLLSQPLISSHNIKGTLPLTSSVDQIQSLLNIFITKGAQLKNNISITPAVGTPSQIHFTPRETEFLSLYKSGMVHNHIADAMHITIHTCNKYKKSINKKVIAAGYNNINQFVLSM